MDTQDKIPEIEEGLEKVGIKGLRTLVRIKHEGSKYKFVPTISLVMDLSEKRKGAHMSRLVESITETIEEEIEDIHGSLEELEKHILESLRRKHPYKKAEIEMKTELVVDTKTPVTKNRTMETHDVSVKVSVKDNEYRKKLEVKVLGNTVCPHSMEYTNGKPHVQRAEGMLRVETDYKNKIQLEDMIECVEQAFSSPVYTLLKTEDEAHVVKEMYAHPKFVEDVAREILSNAKERFKKCRINAKAVSHESIHRHDVVAEGSCET